MSSVAGLYNLSGQPVEPGAARRMVESMRHRGPDGRDVWAEGPVALAHGLLVATPEDREERLPRTSPNAGCTITADVRLDNREELLRSLKEQAPAPSAPDSAFIVAAYERWGTACVDHLVGDFAFAIWDERERRLFLARDHFGAKPLYYVHVPGELFAFASEIKALLALPGVSLALDDHKLSEYLLGERRDSTRTIYEDVKRLPQAHACVATRGGVSIDQYWKLAPIPVAQDRSDASYAEEFKHLFTEAVRCRMRSVKPVGIEVSGGLDSSSVAGVARTLTDEPLHAISLRFPGFAESDEGAYIAAAVEKGRLTLHEEPGDARGRLSDLDVVFEFTDDPAYAVNNHHLLLQRTRMARDAGVGVVLTGCDGDSTVYHGYERLGELLLEGDMAGFDREADLLIRRIRESPHVHATDQGYISPSRILTGIYWPYLDKLLDERQRFRFVRAALYSRFKHKVSLRRLGRRYLQVARERSRRQAVRRDERIPPLIDPVFARRMDLGRRAAEMATAQQDVWLRPVREAHVEHFHTDLQAYTLEGVNQVGAFFGVDPRHPFMDKRLIEFCVSIPASQSMKDGWTRFILRNAMEGIVPDLIRWRPTKANLAPPSIQNMLQLDSDVIEGELSDLGDLTPYVDIEAMREAYRRGSFDNNLDTYRFSFIIAASVWLKRSKQNISDDRASRQQTATVPSGNTL